MILAADVEHNFVSFFDHSILLLIEKINEFARLREKRLPVWFTPLIFVRLLLEIR